MTVYEEVAKMPPFHRKTLVLVGKDIIESIHHLISPRILGIIIK